MQTVRMTAQRDIVLSELRRCSDHPSADDLFERVRRRLPRISLATVYRNLQFLAGCGLIQELGYGVSGKRFDPIADPHSHFRCVNCGQIEDVPLAVAAPTLNPEDSWVMRRKVYGGNLLYYGLCAECVPAT